jgi:hypothetical protein
VITVSGLVIAAIPQITVEPSANLDPARPFTTLFLITNRGRIHVNDVGFGCGGTGKLSSPGSVSFEKEKPIDRLDP